MGRVECASPGTMARQPAIRHDRRAISRPSPLRDEEASSMRELVSASGGLMIMITTRKRHFLAMC